MTERCVQYWPVASHPHQWSRLSDQLPVLCPRRLVNGVPSTPTFDRYVTVRRIIFCIRADRSNNPPLSSTLPNVSSMIRFVPS